MNELITPKELANRIGMSIKFIRSHITDRRLPGMVKCGRFWRFDMREIEKAINNGKLLLD